MSIRRATFLALASAATAISACSAGGAQTRTLVGTFRLDAGRCTSATATPTGSYLAVLDAADNKVVPNPQSTCANTKYTLLAPGSDGGVTAGTFQPNGTPTFDARRDSTSARIVVPVVFLGHKLGMATDAEDVQTGSSAKAFGAPSATTTGTKLTVDLRALNITYGGPPNTTCATSSGAGCWQLGSRSAAGTDDAKTHHFKVDWFVGETFTAAGDSLTVHLEGTFVPAGS